MRDLFYWKWKPHTTLKLLRKKESVFVVSHISLTSEPLTFINLFVDHQCLHVFLHVYKIFRTRIYNRLSYFCLKCRGTSMFLCV